MLCLCISSVKAQRSMRGINVKDKRRDIFQPIMLPIFFKQQCHKLKICCDRKLPDSPSGIKLNLKLTDFNRNVFYLVCDSLFELSYSFPVNAYVENETLRN